MRQPGILFVCTDNASRSPLAEALARELAPPQIEIHSAGLEPTAVHPLTVRVLREVGIRAHDLRAKRIAALPLRSIGTSFALAPEVRRATLPSAARYLYAPFADPLGEARPAENLVPRFRELRDQLASALGDYFKRRARLRVRSARADDVECVRALLEDCRLPLQGVPDDLEALYVATLDDRVVGSVGLERHGAHGLLRSLAVDASCRGQGIASSLCDVAEQRANAARFARIFLLTETAERFFERRGYTALERSDAPPALAASREFSALCPASARLMVREAQMNDRSSSTLLR